MKSIAFLLFVVLLSASAYVPPYPPTWQLNKSTIMMPCSYTNFTYSDVTMGWGITDFDWSNGLAQWSDAVPMDTDERLLMQAQLTKAAQPDTKVWIYRNSAYGYPWFTSVRTILDDQAYSPWFIKFKPNGPWTSPKCDSSYSPTPLCTEYFHTQMDTPRPDSKGYGLCHPPSGQGCNCGTKPCGFYVFNHSSDAVVNGQTFPQWFINTYMFNDIGMSPLVSGFFWDDYWSPSGDMGDNTVNATQDMGLTSADLKQLTASYEVTMALLRARTLAENKFSWQMLWTGGSADATASTCPTPLVRSDIEGCKADLTSLCAPGAIPQTHALMYSFSPGHCRTNTANLTNPTTDIANFQLIRGSHAYIGHGWQACSKTYGYPKELNYDFGEPLGLCYETATDSGVWRRNFTNAVVVMDCNTQEPRFEFF